MECYFYMLLLLLLSNWMNKTNMEGELATTRESQVSNMGRPVT